jgi:hypothetical protein
MNTEVKFGEKVLVERKKVGRFAAGITVLVLGALMVAEAVTSTVANHPFMFLQGVSRDFEMMVGAISIIIAASIINECKA